MLVLHFLRLLCSDDRTLFCSSTLFDGMSIEHAICFKLHNLCLDGSHGNKLQSIDKRSMDLGALLDSYSWYDSGNFLHADLYQKLTAADYKSIEI